MEVVCGEKGRVVLSESFKIGAVRMTRKFLASGISNANLAEIKKRCLLICVDTALRACLRVGVQPDFIVLVDPQYWNIRHLDNCAAPDSVLITELAAYPAVFRFRCREIVLCSSLYPVGAYFERICGTKGALGAGVSHKNAVFGNLQRAYGSQRQTVGRLQNDAAGKVEKLVDAAGAE